MTEIVDLFKEALLQKNKALIETFICLFPKLCYEPIAEAYLISVAKAYDLKHFEKLYRYGEWYLDVEHLPKEWEFLKAPKHKFTLARVKQESGQSLSEEQASALELTQELKDWFSRALHLITGTSPKFCDQTLKIISPTQRVKVPHLRFLLDTKADLNEIKAKLTVLGVPFYADMIRYGQHVLTVPILSFKKIYEVLQLPMGEAPRVDLTRLNPAKEEVQQYLATLFDICFQLEVVKEQMMSRSSIFEKTFNEEEYSDEVEDKALAHCENWVDNVHTAYCDWIRKDALHLVPHGLYYQTFDETYKHFQGIGDLLNLPLLTEASDLSALSVKQKADLFLLCMAPNKLTISAKALFADIQVFDDYVQYMQEVMSQFMPEHIQSIKEITPWQEPYSPSYSLSLSLGSQEENRDDKESLEHIKSRSQEKCRM